MTERWAAAPAGKSGLVTMPTSDWHDDPVFVAILQNAIDATPDLHRDPATFVLLGGQQDRVADTESAAAAWSPSCMRCSPRDDPASVRDRSVPRCPAR